MESRSFINVFCTLDDNRRNSLLEALKKEPTESVANIANVIKDMNIDNLKMILDISSTKPVVPEPVVLEPVVPEPVVPEPVVLEPVVPEPVVLEPVVPEPVVPEPVLPVDTMRYSSTQRVYHEKRKMKEKQVADWIENNLHIFKYAKYAKLCFSMSLIDIHQLYKEQGGTESKNMVSRVLSNHFKLRKKVISSKTSFYGIAILHDSSFDSDVHTPTQLHI